MFVTVNCLVLLPKQVSATKMFKLFSSVINPFRFSEQNVCTSVNNPRPSICLLYELSVITPWNVTAPLESAQQTQCLKLRALFPRRAAMCYDFSIVITALIPNCLSAKISEVLHNYRPSLSIYQWSRSLMSLGCLMIPEQSKILRWLLWVLHPQFQWCHKQVLDWQPSESCVRVYR